MLCGTSAQGGSQVGFAYSGRTKKHHIFGVLDKEHGT